MSPTFTAVSGRTWTLDSSTGLWTRDVDGRVQADCPADTAQIRAQLEIHDTLNPPA